MAAALRAALCSGLLLLLCVSGMIPEPQNVRISSVNLHSTLQWDAPRFPRGNLTYTVQSKSIYYPGDSFETLRTELRQPWCDVSSLSPYGSYVLQLRAEAGQLRSPWVTLTFKPMDDTIIGPPEVRLKSESGALHVDVSGPFAEHEQDRWPLRLYYGSWRYRILYWRKGSREHPASASWVCCFPALHPCFPCKRWPGSSWGLRALQPGWRAGNVQPGEEKLQGELRALPGPEGAPGELQRDWGQGWRDRSQGMAPTATGHFYTSQTKGTGRAQ